jgi:hypothetical protein
MDALKEYKGKMFYISVEKLDHTIEIIYSKDFGNKKIRPRWELQDYPNKTVKQLKQEIHDSFDTTTSFNSNSDLPNIGTNANVRE